MIENTAIDVMNNMIENTAIGVAIIILIYILILAIRGFYYRIDEEKRHKEKQLERIIKIVEKRDRKL